MKIKLLLLLCLATPCLRAEPLFKQLSLVQNAIDDLPNQLTLERIDWVIEQIEILYQCEEDGTEEEERRIQSLEEYSGFLGLLKRYIQEHSPKDLEGLEGWVRCMPWLSVFVDKVR